MVFPLLKRWIGLLLGWSLLVLLLFYTSGAIGLSLRSGFPALLGTFAFGGVLIYKSFGISLVPNPLPQPKTPVAQTYYYVFSVALVALSFLLIPESDSPPLKGTSDASSPSSKSTPMRITDSQINMAVESLTQYPEVIDAAVSCDGPSKPACSVIHVGDMVSLAVVVDGPTSVTRAKELGGNFVRLVMSFGPDNNPGEEIGTSKFSYLVTVSRKDGSTIVIGAKAPMSRRISW